MFSFYFFKGGVMSKSESHVSKFLTLAITFLFHNPYP